jgi:phosphatidylserine synthase
MLTRNRSSLSWPRLAGIASGVFGVSLAVASAAQFWAADSFRGQGLPSSVAAVCGCLFLFLAFPLYAGRDWARRAFLATTYFVLAAIAISFSLMVVQQARMPSASHPTLRLLIGLCALITILTPPAFVLVVLHHRDVRRAFQAQDAPNHAMERTADRSASTF